MTHADGVMSMEEVPRITIQAYRRTLIASVQVDLDERVLRRFQEDLLGRFRATNAEAVVLDLSGVRVIDADDFEGIQRVATMASLMGVPTTLCGIRPGVAAALVDLGVSMEGIRTSLNLDAALAALDAPDREAKPADESCDDADPEPLNGDGGNENVDIQ